MLRENPEFAHTPIIIVTALDNNDSRVVAYGAGASDYITKPYLPRELTLKISDLITK
jgi:DNA-binding response OmpR family regulator